MLRFAKYHGLGNDFILIDGLSARAPEIGTQEAIRLCDRHFGIGAYGVLLALPSTKADYRMRLLNSDGSEPEMCGNGIRCLAQFVWDEGLIHKTEMTVETLAGIMRPRLSVENRRVTGVSVELGKPLLLARDVPTTLVAPEARALDVPLDVDGTTWRVTALYIGVPHCVVLVADVEDVDRQSIGPRIEHHPVFPRKTNVMFTQILAPDHLLVRSWERGAGATLACGTGACAAVVATVLMGRAERDARVTLPGGTLQVQWDAGSDEITLTGPAQRVFAGVMGE